MIRTRPVIYTVALTAGIAVGVNMRDEVKAVLADTTPPDQLPTLVLSAFGATTSVDRVKEVSDTINENSYQAGSLQLDGITSRSS